MKKYAIVNTEPNCNILGLDPIIHAFWDEEMEKLTGRRLTIFTYQLEDGVMNAMPIKEEWFGFGAYLFEKMVADHDFYKKVHSQLMENGGKLYALCQQMLSAANLQEAEIKTNLLEIYRLFTAICVPGLIAPMVEMGGGAVGKRVEEILQSKKLSDFNLNLSEALTILISPDKTTWTEEFRDALYQLAQKIYEDKNNANLITDFVNKYGWVFYGYCGPKYTVANAKEELKNILAKKSSPRELLNAIKNNFSAQLAKQRELMGKLEFSEDEKYWVAVAQDFGYTKAYRANLMALANYTANKFLEVFAREEGYSMKQIGVCTAREAIDYLLGKAGLPDVDILNKRLVYALLISRREKDEVLSADEARNWIKENVEKEEIDLNIKELSGTVACTGGIKTARGRVKIVMNSSENNKVKTGDIMLSSNTVPDHVPAMRRAGAIITQTGGLTCHAAIVSRELNKPCLIGVKHLLEVFKDGDEVEVDAEKGMIKKL